LSWTTKLWQNQGPENQGFEASKGFLPVLFLRAVAAGFNYQNAPGSHAASPE